MQWIDVDCINFAAMRKCEGFQGVVVFAINDGMKGLVAAAFHFSGADEAGVDVISKLRNHDEVFDWYGLYFWLCRAYQLKPGGTFVCP